MRLVSDWSRATVSRDLSTDLKTFRSIIAVPPVASITALICTFAPRLNLYLDFCRVLVFAKSLNSLFNLIVDYFGGVKVSRSTYYNFRFNFRSTFGQSSVLGNDVKITEEGMVFKRVSLQGLSMFT